MKIRKLLKPIFALIIFGLIARIAAPLIYDYYKDPIRRTNALLKKARSLAESKREFAGVIFEKGIANYFLSENKGAYRFYNNPMKLDFKVNDCTIIYSPYGTPVINKISLEGNTYISTFSINIESRKYLISPYNSDLQLAKK